MKNKFLCLCCLLFLNMAHSLHADPAARLQSLQEKYDIVGVSAVAVKSGEVVWHGNLGAADIGRELPVTAETKFRIASISKIAASAALMQLWEQEKFQLDGNIGDVLGYPVVNPYFPDEPITFRHLLTHTSSLRDGPNYNRFLMAAYRAGENAADLRELIHADGESYHDGANFAQHKPGDEYAYSNLNFGLIGTLVEKLSGERFDAYCRKNIFEPLGMVASFNEADLPDINLLGVLYRPGENGWEPQFDDRRGEPAVNRIGPDYLPGRNGIVFSPQGGLRTSALDLAKLMKQFMKPAARRESRILKQMTIDLMLLEHWSNGKEGNDYRGRGLGFQRIHNLVPGEAWTGHGGDAYGLLARMYFQPGGDTGVIVVTNGSRPGEEVREMREMERDLLEAILEFLPTFDLPKAAGPDPR